MDGKVSLRVTYTLERDNMVVYSASNLINNICFVEKDFIITRTGEKIALQDIERFIAYISFENVDLAAHDVGDSKTWFEKKIKTMSNTLGYRNANDLHAKLSKEFLAPILFLITKSREFWSE